MRGDEDFFSVARTIPLVACRHVSHAQRKCSGKLCEVTFDSECSHTLVDRIQSIFWRNTSQLVIQELGWHIMRQHVALMTVRLLTNLYQLATVMVSVRYQDKGRVLNVIGTICSSSRAYLGEKVVKENEYLSAMTGSGSRTSAGFKEY